MVIRSCVDREPPTRFGFGGGGAGAVLTAATFASAANALLTTDALFAGGFGVGFCGTLAFRGATVAIGFFFNAVDFATGRFALFTAFGADLEVLFTLPARTGGFTRASFFFGAAFAFLEAAEVFFFTTFFTCAFFTFVGFAALCTTGFFFAPDFFEDTEDPCFLAFRFVPACFLAMMLVQRKGVAKGNEIPHPCKFERCPHSYICRPSEKSIPWRGSSAG
ncbi:MAG: hypothetical protein IPI81_00595 [Flavobacteriales bacterium]|nr:hypothetical protein [Flavobacteriales bacterium]MCC6939377.1 hypothetical protein [Flavobacteriales bacterium]